MILSWGKQMLADLLNFRKTLSNHSHDMTALQNNNSMASQLDKYDRRDIIETCLPSTTNIRDRFDAAEPFILI